MCNKYHFIQCQFDLDWHSIHEVFYSVMLLQ